jgi:hydrogenase maturation factor HypF (carbamoyltransferase family)
VVEVPEERAERGKEMQKLVTLCWSCQNLYKESYDVEVYHTKMVAKPKCENCGSKYTLNICRIKNKEEK